MKKIIVFISLLLTSFSFIDSQIAYGQSLLGLPYEQNHFKYKSNYKIEDLGDNTISISSYSKRDFTECDSSSFLGYVNLHCVKHIELKEPVESYSQINEGFDINCNGWNYSSIESITFTNTESLSHIDLTQFSNLTKVVVWGTPTFDYPFHPNPKLVLEVQSKYLDSLRQVYPFRKFKAIDDNSPFVFDSRIEEMGKQIAQAENNSTIYINGFNEDIFETRYVEDRFNRFLVNLYKSDCLLMDISSMVERSGKILNIVIGEDCFAPNAYYDYMFGFWRAESIVLPSSLAKIKEGTFEKYVNLKNITLNGFSEIYDNIVGANGIVPTIHVHKEYLRKYKKAYPHNVFVAIEKEK